MDLQDCIQRENGEVTEDALAAWILPISPTQSVAVGRYELKYIEYVNNIVDMPGLPAFCERGFVWRNRFLPALDLWSLFTRRRMPAQNEEHLTAIVAFENKSGAVDLGAILLAGVPKLMAVQPTQSVSVGELRSEWQLIAQAAFKDHQHLYPVLDLTSLFDKTPADLLSLH